MLIVLAVWTTSGTFMLFFLAALQNISEEAEEASEIDGATSWQRFRHVTLPMLRPIVLLVATLGFIGTWQVFDQSYLTGPHNPTMVTPAFLAYQVSFSDYAFGEGRGDRLHVVRVHSDAHPPAAEVREGGSHQVRTRSHRSLHWQILVYVLLGVFALVYLAPFAIQLANSFKTDADASVNGLSPIPHPATLLAWDQIFGISNVGVTDFPRWLFNSAFVSTVLTVSRVFLDSLAGYALARLDFRGRRIVFGLIVATASCCSSRAF